MPYARALALIHMKSANSIRLDRTAFSVSSIENAKRGSRTFWRDKTPYERLEAIEITRQMLYGYDPDTLRLRRVFEILERE